MIACLRIILENNWVCAAFALGPFNRGEALKNISEEYDRGHRYQEAWIRKRIEQHTVPVPASEQPNVSASQKAKETRRVSEFSTRRRNGAVGQSDDPVDEWNLFNSDSDSVNEIGDEPILDYWKRMGSIKQLPALAHIAREVLGLSASKDFSLSLDSSTQKSERQWHRICL